MRPATVRSASFRKTDLSFEKAFSMGLKSGLEVDPIHGTIRRLS